MKIRYRKIIAGVTVYAHLIVYGFGGTAVAEDATGGSVSESVVTETGSGSSGTDEEGQDSGAGTGGLERARIGNGENRDKSSENSYYGSGYEVNQGVRRGAGTSSGSVKKTQRRLIDTVGSEEEPQMDMADTASFSGKSSGVEGDDGEQVSTPGLRLGSRGRKIALGVSAVVVGVVIAVVYFSFLRNDDSSDVDRVPSPPDPPEV